MMWTLLLIGIIMANIYTWKKYTQKRKKITKIISFIVLLLLTIPTIVYFTLFFTGNTTSSIIIPLSYVAGTYCVILLYSTILFLLFDFIMLLIGKDAKKSLSPNIIIGKNIIILIISICITIYGGIHMNTLKIQKYQLSLEQKESTIDQLHAVIISDLHMNTYTNMTNIINNIQQLNPDIIFMLGDFIDEGSSHSVIQKMIAQLKTLQAPYGIYYIPGNHEKNTKDYENYLKQLKESNIQVLQDDIKNIDNQFYIVGRKDKSMRRKPLGTLLADREKNLPTILLSHRPNTTENKKNSIDLQLSAHTHNGQIFPFKPFDFISNTFSYGHYKYNNYQMIVTSGTSTWGIPFRIGSNNEIVDLHVNFK